MDHYIIGTAGHIDHGKTELIKALTGNDTDTLKEEKKRGISIDLGFTSFQLNNGQSVGIVDVPGHEKFLNNMLAGVCSMDLVLLVIALDDGIMPQTIEHVEILSEIGVQRGIVVLTKSDCVDTEWTDLIENEINEWTRDTICKEWPKVRVSSVNGEGIEELKKVLEEQLYHLDQFRLYRNSFRMPIDRVLSIEGQGTVVTGTILDGEIHEGDIVELYPSEMITRVRGIQSHGEVFAKLEHGQRAALLLNRVSRAQVERGAVLAQKDSLSNSQRLDVRIHLANHTKRFLKNRSRVHVYLGTAHIIGRVLLFGVDEMSAGESAYAQIFLEEPVAVREKDRFVIRFYSPMETMGGGVVLHANPQPHKRSDKNILDYFEQLERDDLDKIWKKQICEREERLFRKEEWDSEAFARIERWKDPEIVILHGKKIEYVTSKRSLDNWKEQVANYIQIERKCHPYRRLFSKSLMKKDIFSKWEIREYEVLLQYFQEKQWIQLQKGGIQFLEYPVQKDNVFLKTRELFLEALRQAKYQFVHWEALCPSGMELEHFKDILDVLVAERELIQISEAFYILPEHMVELLQLLNTYFSSHEILTYGQLRDLLHTTKRSIRPLISYLDEMGITKPCGKETERRKGEEFIEFSLS